MGVSGGGGGWGQPGTCPRVLRCWHTQPSISARQSRAAACPRRDLGHQNPEGTRLYVCMCLHTRSCVTPVCMCLHTRPCLFSHVCVHMAPCQGLPQGVGSPGWVPAPCTSSPPCPHSGQGGCWAPSATSQHLSRATLAQVTPSWCWGARGWQCHSAEAPSLPQDHGERGLHGDPGGGFCPHPLPAVPVGVPCPRPGILVLAPVLAPLPASVATLPSPALTPPPLSLRSLLNSNKFTLIGDNAFAGLSHLQYLCVTWGHGDREGTGRDLRGWPRHCLLPFQVH